MLWSRRLCPFGLPDEAEGIDNIVLASIGHFLRAATADDGEPLPVRFVSLLGQLERQERIARARRDASPRRRQGGILRGGPTGLGAPHRQPPDRRIDGDAAGKVLATP
jgi:hypothetical protein